MARVGTHSTRLIVIRGNAGTGKSSLAAAIRASLPRGVAIIGHDQLRREIEFRIPGIGTVSGRPKKATPVLNRRVKQAIAEWCVLNMIELAWDGFIEHTKQGFNIGKPPYG